MKTVTQPNESDLRDEVRGAVKCHFTHYESPPITFTERERVSTEGEVGVGRAEPVNITPLQHTAYPTTHTHMIKWGKGQKDYVQDGKYYSKTL